MWAQQKKYWGLIIWHISSCRCLKCESHIPELGEVFIKHEKVDFLLDGRSLLQGGLLYLN
jgi:hypothetical protein